MMPAPADSSLASRPPGPAVRPFTALELAFTRLFIPIAAASWMGVLLAELGAFTLGRVLAGAGLLTAAAWALASGELRAESAAKAPAARWSHLWLGVALVAAAVVYSRPGEYLIEGNDASVYLAVGHSLHRTGTLVPADPVLQILPADARGALLERDHAWPYLLNRFPGGIQVASGQDSVVPNFFHLLPVWIAMFVGAVGPRGGYYVNVVFGVLAVLTTWLVGRRAWSATSGVVAAVLVAVNFGQVWHARVASSEMLAQWLLLAGIFFTLAAHDRHSRVAAACAGVAIGLAGFVRIDTLFLLLPLAAAWLALARRQHLLGRAWPWYVAFLGVVGAHALAHALTISAPYTLRLAATAWNAAGRVITSLGVGVFLAIATAAIAATIAGTRALPARARIPVLAGAIVLAPACLSPGVVSTASLLLTPVGVVAVAAGFFLTLLRDTEGRLLPLVAPFAAEAVLWLAWREKTTWPADFRRFVPAMLPLGLLLVGGLVADVARAHTWGRRVAWLLPAGLAAAWLAQASPVLLAPPMRGVHAQLEQVASRIPPAAIVLTDGSLPGHLSLALQSTFGRSGLRLSGRVPSEVLQAFIERVHAAGRPVYVALADYTIDAPLRLGRSDLEGLRVTPAGVVALRYAMLASTVAVFPRSLRTIETVVELYEVGRADGPPLAALPLVIDLGQRDFAFALRGLYSGESMSSARARWTSGEAQIVIPRLAAATRNVTLVLRLAAYRPAGMAPPTVRVSLDGAEIGTIAGPGPGFSAYRFALDDRVLQRLQAGDSTLTIQTDTFVPKAAGLGGDARVLGIALDWIRLE